MIFELMNDAIEIDLRKLILQLVRRWWQIIGFAAILAVLAFLITSLMPKAYQATALVAVTQPSYQLNFDYKIQSVNVQPASKVYLDLAISDDVLNQVYTGWAERPASITDLAAFRKQVLQVESGSDPSILKLTAKTESPIQSAKLANLWATTLVDKAKAIYFGQEQQFSFLQEQMAAAQKDLDQAEKGLVNFQAQNQIQLLTNQLQSALQNQSEYLAIQRNLAYINQNIQGLRAQLSANRSNNSAATSQISLLLLQIQAYNTQVNSTSQQLQTASDSSSSNQYTSSSINPFPLQIQVADPASLGNLTSQEQITLLDNLAASLADQASQVTDQLIALSPEILNLQAAVEGYRVILDQLERTRDIAEETYTTLAQKVDEVRIAEQDPSTRLQLASNALVPVEPLSQNRLRNAVLAGFAGGIIAVIIVLVWEWWRGQATPEDK